MSGDRGQLPLFLFFGILAGISAYIWGLGQYRLKKTIEYTPTSKAISVAPGIAEVAGTAQPYKELFTSPFGGQECAYYETRVYSWSGSGKNRHRNLAKVLEPDAPFYIEDETGKVLVRMHLEGEGEAVLLLFSGRRNLSKEMVDRDFFASGNPMVVRVGFFKLTKQEGDAKMEAFLEKNVPSLAGYCDRVDVEERNLSPGEQLYLLGVAAEEEVDGKPQMVIHHDKERGIFCIADGTEKRVLSSMNIWTYAALAIGPAVFAVCFALLDEAYVKAGISQFAWPAAFVMYAYVVFVLGTEFYNGMVVLKNSVGRARANVDALLARRSELISNLVEVVKAASKHERAVQAQVAKLRAESPGAAKELFAIAENYPVLTAAENYRSLQEELSRTESWIAGARSYVADSVMLYNTRVSSFPYMLLAAAAGLKPMEQKME